MKIILSRKGFDCSNGNMASPIMPDGTLVPFHIPRKATCSDPKTDSAPYSSLSLGGLSYGDLICDLSGGKYGPDTMCHIDPDLERNRHVDPPEKWKPAFGQIGAPQQYLKDTVGIRPGDLFLFFGTYHRVLQVNGKYRFMNRRDSTDFYDNHDLHLIWGYLQIGDIIETASQIQRYYWHPHGAGARLARPSNTLYLPADHLSFAPYLPGCGILSFAKKRVLTQMNGTKATWSKNPAYDVGAIINNKGRRNLAENTATSIYYRGIWQELGFSGQVSEAWAQQMLT